MRVLVFVATALAACQPLPPQTEVPLGTPQKEATADKSGYALGFESLSASAFDFEIRSAEPFEEARVDFVLTNTSGQAIAAFKGKVLIEDVLDDVLKVVDVTDTKDFGVNETIRMTGFAHLNPYIDRDMRLKGTVRSKLRFVWYTTVIAYADGTRLETKPLPPSVLQRF